MDDMEYIDQYLNTAASEKDQVNFEQRIISDPAFAQMVAFYIAAKEAFQLKEDEETKSRFRQLYESRRQSAPVVKLARPMWQRFAAAAVVVGVLFGAYLFMSPASPQQMANKYIKNNLAQLPAQMSPPNDSIALGEQLYENGKLAEALALFERQMTDPKNVDQANKFAGLVSLRLKNYDNALRHFESLAAETGLEVNHGKFYMALTLMKRNQAGDEERAKVILQEVIDKDLAGKETALEWIEKW